MLRADYDKLPSFPIPAHVSDASDTLDTFHGSIRIYRFDDNSIGLWWLASGTLHQLMVPIIEQRAEWNTNGKFWFVKAEMADRVLMDIEAV